MTGGNVPVVFATDAPTASGHKYNDVLGKQYEFPLGYQTLVVPGDPFVYYRGARGSRGRRPAYFGVGTIGALSDSATVGQMIAEIHDVELFDEPVSARASDGTYLETGTMHGTNWPNGVRRISDEALERIVRAAGLPAMPEPSTARPNQAFASAQHASVMERYSIEVALELLAREFEASAIREMPPGHPGYDILVEQPDANLHIEVKGTVLPDPVFHLSEGQRQHAVAYGAQFRLIVVYRIDLRRRTHRVATVEGPLTAINVHLQPDGWIGLVSR